jgi:cytochrome c oxidase subunit IV
MDTHDSMEFKRHIRTYVWVFVALLVATVITVAVSYFHFGAEDSHVGNVTVALLIAGFKAFLVAAFFMHLISERLAIYVLVGFTAAHCFGMITFTVYDYYSTPDMTEHTQKLDQRVTRPVVGLRHEP